MNVIKFIAVATIVAVMSDAVWAATPVPPPFTLGTLQLKSRNEDNGTAYFINDPAAFATGGPGGTSLYGVALDPDNLPASVTRIKPIAAQPQPGVGTARELEDTWGIVNLYFIKSGQLLPESHQIAGLPGATAWDNSNGTEGTWVVGIFYGGNDTAVSFTNPLKNNQLLINTEHVHFELWAVDKATLAASALANGVGPIDSENLVDFDAANRTAPNIYKGWVDGIGIKLVTGVSTEFQFDGTISNTGTSFDGQTSAYFDIDQNDASGLWNSQWGSNPQLVSLVNGIASDAYFTWDLQNDNRGWSVHSTDLGGATTAPSVPEPLTMLGLTLAVGSVGGYIRRRRIA